MRKSLVFILFLIACGCTDIQLSEKPDDFYGDEKMADILTDLYLMEGSMSNNRSSFTKLNTLPTDYIYSKYNTDSTIYRNNFLYYADRIEKYEKILEIVKENLEVVKDSVDSRQKRVNEKKLDPAVSTELIKDPDNL